MFPDSYTYSALFVSDGDGWEVSFPDVDNAFTAADTLEEAKKEARFVLEDIMYFREKEGDIPNVTPLENISVPKGALLFNVTALMKETRQEFAQKNL